MAGSRLATYRTISTPDLRQDKWVCIVGRGGGGRLQTKLIRVSKQNNPARFTYHHIVGDLESCHVKLPQLKVHEQLPTSLMNWDRKFPSLDNPRLNLPHIITYSALQHYKITRSHMAQLNSKHTAALNSCTYVSTFVQLLRAVFGVRMGYAIPHWGMLLYSIYFWV